MPPRQPIKNKDRAAGMKLIDTILNLFRFNQKNWKAVVLCLVAATIFWFFNALNKSNSANINFPVTFEYDEEVYIPVKPLPHYVKLNVSGLGWDLFRKSLGVKVSPLRIPLENPSETKKIVGASLPPLFSPQLEGVQINFVLTDTIHLQIDQKTTRQVFVAIRSLDAYLKEDVGLSEPVRIQPERITLEGPQSLLKAFSDTLYITLPVQNIDKSYEEDIEVEFESNLIRSDPPVVRVSLSVDKLLEITDNIPLQFVNLPRDIRATLLVKDVSCTYRLPVTLAHSLAPDSLFAVLDLSGLARGKHKLVPAISGLPAFSRLLQVDSVVVNF
jgi:YbbR domain-containing protein